MKPCTTLLVLFATLALALAVSVLFFPMAYLYATYENLYGEWLQFAAFAAIAVYCVRIIRLRPGVSRWFWTLLGLAAFYVAMEEISWGQQIFHWESGEFFQKVNQQGETNLHNIFTGPYSTLKKQLLTYAVTVVFFIGGVVYPLLHRKGWSLAIWLEGRGVPVPPLCLIPFFLLAAIAELSLFTFNEAELAELFGALGVCFMAVGFHWQMSRNTERGLAGRYMLVFAVLAVVSIGMTQMSLNSSYSKQRVANRIEAGVKKFAGRYQRYGAHQHAINLYRKHLGYSPGSRSRMRRLASAYRQAGDRVGANATLQAALEIDLDILKREPWRASVRRSLYRTYRSMGDTTAAAKQLQGALKINLRRLKDHPESADAAYSIAQTYTLLGRNREALEQYKRAFELKPSSKHRRAYRDALDEQ
jgi:tetratricopeptide (TPR) repeat protein